MKFCAQLSEYKMFHLKSKHYTMKSTLFSILYILHKISCQEITLNLKRGVIRPIAPSKSFQWTQKEHIVNAV